ncbi:MAG TPA: efflux transporter outer membrane subunit [Steroidobacteraceae bacterium]|nr:efflux transporter outer membrane subunit [Steroidobacteraceae bacterium]
MPLTTLLLAAFLSGGCAPSEHYVRPADPPQTGYIQTPAQAGGTIGGTAGQAVPQVSLGEYPPDAWWTLLGSDQVNHLVLLALKNNHSLAVAKAHLAAARERIRAARGAWYPQVDASAGAQRTRFVATVLGPLAKDFPIFSAYAAGPQVSYDLDVFGGTKARVAHAAAAAQFESAELGAVALSISGNVVIEVLEIATVRSQIRVVNEIVADDEHFLGLIRAAREAGAVSALDVLSAQSQADHDRTLLPPLHQQLSVAQDALAILIGMSPRDWTPIAADLDAITPMDRLPVVLPSELVRRRPDIGAAEAQLHAASAALGVATAEMYPHFTLTARIGQEGLLGGGPSETAWNLLGGLTAPIFHGGALTAQRRAAEDEYQAAFAAYQQVVLNAFAQVADTLQALSNDADSLRAQGRALDSASASLALTKQGYAAGNAGYLQVLDAQRLQQQARLGEVLASGQRHVDAVKLLLAAGGRVEMPEP